jgi:alpha-beta hydrolase superfamily lysophospholipase
MPDLKTEDGFVQRGETALSYHALLPAAPRAILVIVHGLSEHKGRYLRLQRELADQGYANYSYDQRGFGLSSGTRTYVQVYTDFLLDLKEVLGFVRRRHPNDKVILLGHSFGGAVSATFCIDYPAAADALVLSAPAYEVPTLPLRLELLGHLLNRVMPARSIRYRNNPEYLSRDTEIGVAFRKDPLTQRAGTPRFYTEFRKMNLHLREETGKIVLPTLILQGSGDRIVIPEGARKLLDRLGSSKKKLIWYDGFYHEVFNEIGRERVIADLVAWLKEHIG